MAARTAGRRARTALLVATVVPIVVGTAPSYAEEAPVLDHTHAHPDDEAISTGGAMVKAAAAGHRVVLVCATDGAVGEPVPGSVPEGSTLGSVRLEELKVAGEILGASRVEWLGYGDSGMDAESTNDHPDCFWQADVEVAATRLATQLTFAWPIESAAAFCRAAGAAPAPGL